MTVPVFFLEPASGHASDTRNEVALETALGLVKTLLAAKKINPKVSLNTPIRLHDCEIAPGRTLSQLLANAKSHQPEWDFLRNLATSSPLHSGFETWLAEAELSEVKLAGGKTSEALLWANLLDTGTVSFHVRKEWLAPWVTVECGSLDENLDFTCIQRDIRNASTPNHLNEHRDWLKSIGFDALPSAKEFWMEREYRFSGLRFLNRVEDDIDKLATSGIPYIQVINTLSLLNENALQWNGLGEPQFSCKVADGEHDQRRQLSTIRDDISGNEYEFGKHAYFWMGKSTSTPAGRIHFRIDAVEKKFVIAYAGFKLKAKIPG